MWKHMPIFAPVIKQNNVVMNEKKENEKLMPSAEIVAEKVALKEDIDKCLKEDPFCHSLRISGQRNYTYH